MYHVSEKVALPLAQNTALFSLVVNYVIENFVSALSNHIPMCLVPTNVGPFV